TRRSFAPSITALNACVAPASSETKAGLTETVTVGGFAGSAIAFSDAPPHAMSTAQAEPTITKRLILTPAAEERTCMLQGGQSQNKTARSSHPAWVRRSVRGSHLIPHVPQGMTGPNWSRP